VYHKQRLVPFGEYIPLESAIRGLIPFFDLPMSSFRAGDPEQDLLKVTVHSGEQNDLALIAPYICYEIAYPDLVLQTARHADLLVTISNDAWFGDSLGPKQHMALAQMRALETGRWVLRSTNTGISALVNHHGDIVQRIPVGERTGFSAVAERRTGETLYMKTGLTPLLILAFGLTGLATLIRGKRHG
jgi:apolipoprotein N-acyltransferase